MSVTYGYHSSNNRGYLSAIERPIILGARAVQLWVGNGRGYASKMLPPKVCEPVAELVAEKEVFLISHSPYILNFARPLQSTSTGIKALQRYVNDLINITNLGGRGSILHMGANVEELKQTREEAYQNFADNLGWVLERIPENAIIILENMAGGGTRMCCELADWTEFWNDYLDDDLKEHVKWCVDTAHLYAAGEYDLSQVAEVKRFYREFDESIGWENILCFHFNGSKSAFGSHHDNHADIGPTSSGQIKTIGLKTLAKIAAKTNKPLILETPGESQTLTSQFKLINSWFE